MTGPQTGGVSALARQAAKALSAAATAAAGALATAGADDGFTGGEIVLIVVTALGAAAAVFATRNEPAPGTGRRRADGQNPP